MIPEGRTHTSVWQIHSLGDLKSILSLSLSLHCSWTPCDSHWFRRQLDQCWDRQSLSSASQNSWWAMSQCLSCTKSVWCCWLQQARLTEPSWGPGHTHRVSPLTRGKFWKMQSPEGGHPEIHSEGYTHSTDIYTALEGNRLVFPHCFISLVHFPRTTGLWAVILARIPVFVLVVFWIGIVWQPSAWELFITFWWLECKLHLSIFPLRKHKKY